MWGKLDHMMKNLFLSLIVCLGLAGLSPVSFAANKNSSCVGVLASFFAEEGLSDEVAVLKAIAEDLDIPFGQLVRQLARETGTVDECLAIVGL